MRFYGRSGAVIRAIFFVAQEGAIALLRRNIAVF
jgi:hypothetical protein